MLFALIAIAWLAIVTIIVAACRTAARADAIATATAERDRRSPGPEAPFPELTRFPGLTVPGARDPIRQERLSVLAAGRTGRARRSAATAHRHAPRVGARAGRGARRRGERHA